MPRTKKNIITTDAPEGLPVTEVTESITLTPDELQAIKALRAQQPATAPAVGIAELTQALVAAIETTRPPQKKNTFNRKPGDPWRSMDGTPKPKLKRVWLQHGRDMNPDQLYPEEINLLNQVKPGTYCKGLVNIYKRRDRSYDITWQCRTNAQRLRVINEAGSSLVAILQRCIAEHADPKKFKGSDELDED